MSFVLKEKVPKAEKVGVWSFLFLFFLKWVNFYSALINMLCSIGWQLAALCGFISLLPFRVKIVLQIMATAKLPLYRCYLVRCCLSLWHLNIWSLQHHTSLFSWEETGFLKHLFFQNRLLKMTTSTDLGRNYNKNSMKINLIFYLQRID